MFSFESMYDPSRYLDVSQKGEVEGLAESTQSFCHPQQGLTGSGWMVVRLSFQNDLVEVEVNPS